MNTYQTAKYGPNSQSYRTMGTYYGDETCRKVPGLDTLATGPIEYYTTSPYNDYGNCQLVVPSDAAMGYGKIFDHPDNSRTYRGYFNVPDGYAPAQNSCGQYTMRQCQ
jgi:hypothetical protein